MKERMLLIVNPTSGTMRVKNEFLNVCRIFCEAGFSLEVHVTSGPRDGARTVYENAGRFDLVVACGGDGTFNEAVSGALRGHFGGSVGFLPAGTTNDLAGSIAIPKNLVKAAELIAHTPGRFLDFGSFNRNRYFTYIASFGAFTDVSYSTDQKLKHVFGHMAYIAEAIGKVKDLRAYRMRVDLDGDCFEDEFLFGAAFNSFSIGGVMKLKKNLVDLTDGNHEVILVRNPKSAEDVAHLSRELLSGEFENKSVLFLRGKKIVFECEEEIPWCLDGEFAGKHRCARIRNLHERLRVIYPAKDTP